MIPPYINLIKFSLITLWLCATCSTFGGFGLSIVHFEPEDDFDYHLGEWHAQHPDPYPANQLEIISSNLTNIIRELETLMNEITQSTREFQELEDTESESSEDENGLIEESE